jgi:pimeloyl-ACP methyl ester carboxylesterase
LQLDVEAVANHLKLQDINIIGYSDGGVVAYRLAAANRIPIRKIVTIGAGWSLSDVEVNEKLLADMTPEKFKSWFRRDYDEFAKSLLAMWTDKTEDGYPLASIETISVPTLIIRGNDDAWFPFESAVEFTTKVQKSLLFNIPFAPHAAFRKYPHFFEVITKEFLNGK